MDELVKNLLIDMRTYAGHAVRFVEGKSLDDFRSDMQLQLATIRAIEVVGEAAWKVDAKFKDGNTSIAWAQMAGMRHRLIHGYGTINLEIVFSTALQFLPELIVQLDELLGDT